MALWHNKKIKNRNKIMKKGKTNRLKAKLRRKRTKQVLRVTRGERKYSR